MDDHENRITAMAALDPVKLYTACDVDQFQFKTTEDLEGIDVGIGQSRAVDAIRFGVRVPGKGYNLYVLGPPGSGRHSMARRLLQKEGTSKPTPGDWCYINDFETPQSPRAICLPAGRGLQLRDDMKQLIEELQSAIPAAFERDEYRNQVAEIDQEFEERSKEAMSSFEKKAQAEDVELIQTPQGYALTPMLKGQSMDERVFQKLPEKQRKHTEQKIQRLSKSLKEHLEQLPLWNKERRDKVKELDRRVAVTAVGSLIEDLKKRYGSFDKVVAYLDAVQSDVLDNIQHFRKHEELPFPLGFMSKPETQTSFGRYEVNVLVCHEDGSGAPIVYEPNPTYQNLVGRVEHTSQFGTLSTDFRMIRAGVLHRAIGGYLILDADRLLMQPYAWQGLKQALFGGEIRIESLGQMLSLISTTSLEPEPIPLDVKVILVGGRQLYYLLYHYDPDFAELFKVSADFEDRIDRTPEGSGLYARLIATLAKENKLRPFDRQAVGRVIEYGARLQEDADKLSTHMRSISDLIREADHWAAVEEKQIVDQDAVEQAIERRIRRVDRVRSNVQEAIDRDLILIDTEGEKVAQVNGLSVIQLGDFSFGHPTRITATVRSGKGEVIDIEREVNLGGAIHSKGVMIISSFIGARYARDLPLSLSASLVFEQSYGGVEGDSASVGELCALLSALSGLPIKQDLAVTGSVNQLGRVQVIGGVNEKIEGFFDICKSRGLTGSQGVLIPRENIKHLMLRRDVVAAAEQGRFHIYSVQTIDEAISVLTGVQAGERDAQGEFPPDGVNARVQDGLRELARVRREFAEQGRTGQASQ